MSVPEGISSSPSKTAFPASPLMVAETISMFLMMIYSAVLFLKLMQMPVRVLHPPISFTIPWRRVT